MFAGCGCVYVGDCSVNIYTVLYDVMGMLVVAVVLAVGVDG